MADAKLNIIITAKDQTKGVIKGLGGSVQKLGKVAIAGAALGVGALTAGVTALSVGVYKLAEDAANLETVKAAFEGITAASGESADEMMKALREQSAGMINNRQLMESYNKAAQLVGTTFANELPGAMGMVGKVAAATGQDMGFLMDSLVTGIGRLSPMILDNLGVQVDLTQAYEDYADANGLVVSEMSKTEQQAALMEQVMTKLQENTAAMPDLAGSAAASFESFKVTLQNTKDEIGLALIPVVQPLMETLGNLASVILPPLVEVLQNSVIPVLKSVTEFISAFFDAIAAGADPLTAFNYALYSAFPPEVAKRIIEIKDKVVEFVDKIRTALQPVIDFISKNVEMKDVLIALGVVITAVIIPLIASLIVSIAPLLLIFAALVAAVALIRTAWEENWGGIQEKTEAVIKFIEELIAAFKKGFEGDWTDLAEMAQKIWDNLWIWVGERLDDFIEWILSINWSQIGMDIINGIKNGVIAATQWLIDALVGAVQAAISAVKSKFGIESPSKVFAETVGVPMVEGIIVGVKSMGGKLASTIGDTIGGAMKKLTLYFPELEDKISSLKRAIESLKGRSSDLKDSMSDIRKEIKKTTDEGIITELTNKYKQLKSTGASLKKELKGLLDQLHELRQELAIKQSIGWLIGAGEWLDEYVGKVEDKVRLIKELFDVGSSVSGFGGSFASRYETYMIDPIKRELKEIEEKLKAEEETVGLLERQAYLRNLLYKEEERINRMRSQQDQLKFLQEQMDLVKLIREYGLDPSDIFGGMELGLAASLPDLIDAMNKAMQAIILTANDELGIASPSKVFERLGNLVMQGFARGIDAASALPQQAFGQSVPAMANTYNSSSNMGNVYINNPAQMSVYLRQQELVRQRTISRKI